MWIAVVIVIGLAALVAYDLIQREHALLRNFPILGHLRYWLEAVGPELRQYIVTGNDDERPFSRDQRRWIYTSAKRRNNYFGFGTDNDLEQSPNYIIIKPDPLPKVPLPPLDVGAGAYPVPCAKVLGGYRQRRHAFRPTSVVNISAMSFGSLSGVAVQALNRGAHAAGCLQNTGEGGVSPHHRLGGDLVWQIGTSYFGCRDEAGRFDLVRFKDVVASAPIRAIELKLSQGAKPGVGGILPAAKITPEIAAIRGIPMGVDCISPGAHSAFHDIDSLLDFVELLASETGLPVGVKSAVGRGGFWSELAGTMERSGRAVDFITIDGGEGGTGAGPLVFSDHVALPFKIGFARVYRAFAERGLHERVVFIGSGKLGFPEAALFAFALGCDGVNVAREAMLSIGCIQAQRCHTGHCPAGITTQSRWLTRGLDPPSKATRLANYVVALRKELVMLARACGVPHPALVTPDYVDILNDRFEARSAAEVFGYEAGWGLPSPEDTASLGTILVGETP